MDLTLLIAAFGGGLFAAAIGGVGLGLALVHTVIHRHGGTLEVDSDVGQGAEFRLVLPLDG